MLTRNLGYLLALSTERHFARAAAAEIRAIPLVDPIVTHQVGLVVPDREPLTPSARALMDCAPHVLVATSPGGLAAKAVGVARA